VSDIDDMINRLNDRQRREFGWWCAERVRHLMSDPRSTAALDVAALHLRGDATAASRAAARAARNAAARAAASAATSARHAARAAAAAAERDAQIAELNRMLGEVTP